MGLYLSRVTLKKHSQRRFFVVFLPVRKLQRTEFKDYDEKDKDQYAPYQLANE